MKTQLLRIYQAEYDHYLKEEERKKHMAEAERAKQEMWRLEEERRKLEAESEAARSVDFQQSRINI